MTCLEGARVFRRAEARCEGGRYESKNLGSRSILYSVGSNLVGSIVNQHEFARRFLPTFSLLFVRIIIIVLAVLSDFIGDGEALNLRF